MIQTLIGTKREQTQGFLSDGTRIPITVIAMPKASVTQVKTVEKDGYSAVQIGIGSKKKATKPLMGHVKKANLSSVPTVLREVKIDEEEGLEVGAHVGATDVFKTGDIIKVSGVGKGKGFQGGVKRHGFRGGPRTHGQSDRERAPGSIGQTTTPGRVYKGKRMAGHMGTGNVSVTNLIVVSVDEEKMLVKGLVPGVLNSTVIIEKTGELKNPLELYESPEEKAIREASSTQDTVAEEVSQPATDNTQQATDTQEEVKEEVAEEEPKEVKSEKGDVVPAEPNESEAQEAKVNDAQEKSEEKSETPKDTKEETK